MPPPASLSSLPRMVGASDGAADDGIATTAAAGVDGDGDGVSYDHRNSHFVRKKQTSYADTLFLVFTLVIQSPARSYTHRPLGCFSSFVSTMKH